MNQTEPICTQSLVGTFCLNPFPTAPIASSGRCSGEEVAQRSHRTKSDGGHGEGATRNYEEMERLTKWGELREIKKHGY